MGLKHNDSCLAKAADDEPLFVLRAHDKLAPNTVRVWAMMARAQGTPSEKVREAMDLADDMEDWSTVNGCKVPD